MTKLRAFDLEDIFWGSEDYNKINYNQIKEEIKSNIIYYKENDTIGLCLEDQKENIIEILKRYGEISIQGNFIKPSTFFTSGSYDWDDIFIGDIEIEGSLVWKEFGELIENNEDQLIYSNNFEDDWYKLQRVALKKCLDEDINKRKEDLAELIKEANEDYEDYIGIYKRKPL